MAVFTHQSILVVDAVFLDFSQAVKVFTAAKVALSGRAGNPY